MPLFSGNAPALIYSTYRPLCMTFAIFSYLLVGLGFTDAIILKDYKDLHARDPEDRPANATVGLVPAILSNRISHFLNLKVGLSLSLTLTENLFDANKGTEHDY